MMIYKRIWLFKWVSSQIRVLHLTSVFMSITEGYVHWLALGRSIIVAEHVDVWNWKTYGNLHLILTIFLVVGWSCSSGFSGSLFCFWQPLKGQNLVTAKTKHERMGVQFAWEDSINLDLNCPPSYFPDTAFSIYFQPSNYKKKG